IKDFNSGTGAPQTGKIIFRDSNNGDQGHIGFLADTNTDFTISNELGSINFVSPAEVMVSGDRVLTLADLSLGGVIAGNSTGDFVGELTGMTTTVTGTFKYLITGNLATIWTNENITGTS